MQELLADIAVETEAARLLAWRAASLADAHVKHTLESSVAKLYASEVAVRAANSAVQVFGGYGYVDEYPVGKYLRDARVTTLYEGTSQIQKLIIGRALTGESAFTSYSSQTATRFGRPGPSLCAIETGFPALRVDR